MEEDEALKQRVKTATRRLDEQERQREDPQPASEAARSSQPASAAAGSSSEGRSAAEKREAPEAETQQGKKARTGQEDNTFLADLVGEDVLPSSPISEMDYELDSE
eukprot:12410636-Karenia_brevis.AAC.1